MIDGWHYSALPANDCHTMTITEICFHVAARHLTYLLFILHGFFLVLCMSVLFIYLFIYQNFRALDKGIL